MGENDSIKVYKLSSSDYIVCVDDAWANASCTSDILAYINGKSLSSLQYIPLSNFPPVFENAGKKYHHIYSNGSGHVILRSENGDVYFIYLNLNTGKNINSNTKRLSNLLDCDTSYALLRANPKLTGNVKVVVDSSSNLFLDTFKVSTAMSQQKYRKIKINPDEYYGRSLMSKMKSITTDDFYKIEDGCYDIFSTANNLGEQYYDKYNSGVRTNEDKMYSENFSILSPLCIKKKLPDFFLIFKLDTYDNNLSNADKIKYFLSHGKLIKSFDMRENSNLGKYIRTIKEQNKKFIGDAYVSYNYDIPNTYNGISLDRGVMTHIYDAASTTRDIKNQVSLNDWITLGYQRNRIVSKDIINLEFMFNDNDASIFSINTYFGFYVRLNGNDTDFTCIKNNQGVNVFDASLSGITYNPSNHPNIIYGYSTQTDFKRLSNNIFQSNDISQYNKKPYECVLTSDCYNDDSDNSKSFCSVQLNEIMSPGEHYRLIDSISKSIYEVVVSNYQIDDETSEISPVRTYSPNDETGGYTIYTVSIYNNSYKTDGNKTNSDEILRQIKNITNAFNKILPDNSKAFNDGINNFSILYNYSISSSTDVVLEKVHSLCGYDDTTDNYIQSEDYSDNSTLFFGVSGIESICVDASTGESNDSSLFSVLHPFGVKEFGRRRVTVVSLLPIHKTNNYIYNISQNIKKYITGTFTSLYKTKNGYDILSTTNYGENQLENDYGINLYYLGNGSTSTPGIAIHHIKANSINGYGSSVSYALKTNTEVVLNNGKINIYKNYPINVGLCSIFPIKDFNFDVIDNVSQFTTSSVDADAKISNTPGEYQTNDNIFGKTISSGTEENICDYIDKFETFKPSESYINSTTMTNYMTNVLNGNHNRSDISLLAPYCCKWKYIGTDHRGLPMRTMFDFTNSLNSQNSIIDGSSYFIPQENDRYIGYLSITDASLNEESEINSHKYVTNNLVVNDIIKYRDYILNGNGRLDDILYTSNHFVHDKWSKAYSFSDDELEFISGGIKIRIKSNNKSIIDLSKYSGYSIMLISMSCGNPTYDRPCELLVDEINEQMLYIVYNGVDTEHMKYHEGENVPIVYQMPHYSAISDCRVTYQDSSLVLSIPDDIHFYNDASIVNENGCIIMTSSKKSTTDYTAEKYIHIVTSLDQTTVYNDKENTKLISSGNIRINIDSSLYPSTNNTLKYECDKYKDNVNVIVISSQEGETNRSASSTLRLKDIKNNISNPSIFIKTSEELLDYTTIDDLLDVNIIDPFEYERENSDFDTTSEGLVYSSFAEPVMKEMTKFIYSDSSINDDFLTNFDGCNIILDDISNINQVWIKKFMAAGAKLKAYETYTTTYDEPSSVITLNLKDLELTKVKPMTGMNPGTPFDYVYYQNYDGTEYRYEVDNYDVENRIKFTAHIDINSLLQYKPKIGDTWVLLDTRGEKTNQLYVVYNNDGITEETKDDKTYYTGSVDYVTKEVEQEPPSNTTQKIALKAESYYNSSLINILRRKFIYDASNYDDINKLINTDLAYSWNYDFNDENKIYYSYFFLRGILTNKVYYQFNPNTIPSDNQTVDDWINSTIKNWNPSYIKYLKTLETFEYTDRVCITNDDGTALPDDLESNSKYHMCVIAKLNYIPTNELKTVIYQEQVWNNQNTGEKITTSGGKEVPYMPPSPLFEGLPSMITLKEVPINVWMIIDGSFIDSDDHKKYYNIRYKTDQNIIHEYAINLLYDVCINPDNDRFELDPSTNFFTKVDGNGPNKIRIKEKYSVNHPKNHKIIKQEIKVIKIETQDPFGNQTESNSKTIEYYTKFFPDKITINQNIYTIHLPNLEKRQPGWLNNASKEINNLKAKGIDTQKYNEYGDLFAYYDIDIDSGKAIPTRIIFKGDLQENNTEKSYNVATEIGVDYIQDEPEIDFRIIENDPNNFNAVPNDFKDDYNHFVYCMADSSFFPHDEHKKIDEFGSVVEDDDKSIFFESLVPQQFPYDNGSANPNLTTNARSILNYTGKKYICHHYNTDKELTEHFKFEILSTESAFYRKCRIQWIDFETNEPLLEPPRIADIPINTRYVDEDSSIYFTALTYNRTNLNEFSIGDKFYQVDSSSSENVTVITTSGGPFVLDSSLYIGSSSMNVRFSIPDGSIVCDNLFPSITKPMKIIYFRKFPDGDPSKTPGGLLELRSLEQDGFYVNKINVDDFIYHNFRPTTIDNLTTMYKSGWVQIHPQEIPYHIYETDSSINVLNRDSSLTSFEYDSLTIENKSGIKNVTTTKEYCTTSMSLYHDFNPLVNCWQNDINRKYTGFDSYTKLNGISTGYEKNTFLSSRGISLKNPDGENIIRLSNYKAPSVLKTENKITINITNETIQQILTTPGYVSNWSQIKKVADKYKTEYIKNNILKHVDIENPQIEIFVNNSTNMLKISSSKDNSFEKVNNIKSKLTYNGEYVLEFTELEQKTYFIIITLKIF